MILKFITLPTTNHQTKITKLQSWDINIGLSWFYIVLCLCQHKKGAPKNNEIYSNVKGPLQEQRKVFGTVLKIMQEGQLVDPLIHLIMQSDDRPGSLPALELISRAASSVGVMYCSLFTLSQHREQSRRRTDTPQKSYCYFSKATIVAERDTTLDGNGQIIGSIS